MALTLVHPAVAAKWDKAFADGIAEKRYPSIDLVRLERWFFGAQPGLALEYAFGAGVNLLHLLERGYTVEGLDASASAVKMVERKLDARPDLRQRARLSQVDVSATRLSFPDAHFDYVVCMGVLSLLASRERVETLLREFFRVAKPGAKIIADINGPNADFARNCKVIGEDTYEFRGLSGKEEPVPTYCPPDGQKLAALLRNAGFVIDDIGFTSHKYFNSEITEFIVCAHKP